jgi:AmmeMemoRadiSam system protein B
MKQKTTTGGGAMDIRKSVFSGSWYPGSAKQCEKEIQSFLAPKEEIFGDDNRLVGGIVPHAGWFFSGQIACNVIHALCEEAPPDAFVIFGMHLHPHSVNYIMNAGAWETPFGELEISRAIADELVQNFSFEIETPNRYTQDNTIELQLPFIKYFFKNVKIVPIGVPPAKIAMEIGAATAKIAKKLGLRIKVLGSTDLTHYGHNYGFTPKGVGKKALDWVRDQNDRELIDAILALDATQVIQLALKQKNACCSGAVAAAITTAKALGAQQAKEVAYATSYDKSPGDSFVGYSGIVFC